MVVKPLPGALVFHSRFVAESYDSYFDVLPALGEELAAANPGLHCPEDGYCFIEYHDREYRDHYHARRACSRNRPRGPDGARAARSERVGQFHPDRRRPGPPDGRAADKRSERGANAPLADRRDRSPRW